jgi:phage recombination protein Bet
MTDLAVRPNGREAATYDTEAGAIRIPTQVGGVFLTFTPDQKVMSEQQLVLLAPLGVEAGWDPRQVAVFLMECQERGLNPWNREAYLMFYAGKYIRHIGIDGFRKRGESTGQYRGRLGPFWCDTDGKWLEFWPHRDRPPVAAKVGLIRSTFDEPVWAVAMYDEYVATKPVWRDGRKTGEVEITAQWKPAVQGGKPSVMLAKVAEAQAWRVTFPERFGGFYAPEEFDKDRAEQQSANPAAEKRKAAFAAAQAGPAAATPAGGDVVDAQVVDDTTDPVREFGDAERELLFAELDEQAEVLGKTVTDLSARWSKSRDGRDIKTATAAEIADHVHRIRPYVLDALREQKRDDEAAKYEQAPPVGTCEELFGRGPVVVDPPADATAPDEAAEEQGEEQGEESAK